MTAVVSPPGGFRCIVADPPWAERGGGKCKRGADRHYPLLATPEIAKVILRSGVVPARSAHLWLWVTNNFLEDGLGLMRTLGFEYVSNFTWVKVRDGHLQIGLGQYMRGAHEICLFGTCGYAMVPHPTRRRPTVLFARRGRHSEKPPEAYDIFEDVSPGPRVELFARSTRPGWVSWGNEVREEAAAG